MWIKREIEEVLGPLARTRPALILTGCRQAGKTSLFQKVFKNHNYVSLDLPAVAEKAEEEGLKFLEDHPAPLIIDEVQYAPKLFRYLKQAIDQQRDKNGLFLLTGSQQFPLMQNVTESLAGRVAILNCHSLSVSELEHFYDQPASGDQLLNWIYQGGYPELHAQSLVPERFYSDYISTYLERDVRQVLQVKSLRDFDRFLRLAAMRTGQLLSYSSLATDVGVSPNTIKSWVSVLQASNIIYLLEPYYKNLGKRLVKTPKLYFMDTGLACFLAGFRSVNDLRQSSMLGTIFETHVLGQIIRWYANRGKEPSLYFYRDNYGCEVDFVIPVGEKLRLIECKWAVKPSYSVSGFDNITKLIGNNNVISKTLITPVRGSRYVDTHHLTIEDSISLNLFSNNG